MKEAVSAFHTSGLMHKTVGEDVGKLFDIGMHSMDGVDICL